MSSFSEATVEHVLMVSQCLSMGALFSVRQTKGQIEIGTTTMFLLFEPRGHTVFLLQD